MEPDVAETVSFLNVIIEDFEVNRDDLIHPKSEKVGLIYFKMLLEFGFDSKVRDYPIFWHIFW